MNYVSFTATPYANVLNEAYRESLYPSNFICCLPESKEYFGPKVIWGSKTDEDYSGLNILREISKDEMDQIKDNNYFRQKMFSGHGYQMVEHLYFNYVISHVAIIQ